MIINVGEGGASKAESLKYDNETSGLSADNVQGAIDELTSEKVDKVSGKGLSTNDYTTDEKNKLAGIGTGANKTVVDTSLSTSSTNPVQNKVVATALNGKVNTVSGKGLSTNDYTNDEKQKLAGIATGATKVIVDSSLSTSSTNAIQNKVATTAMNKIRTYVGSDGKLHFVNASGADTALNFSGLIKYDSIACGEQGNTQTISLPNSASEYYFFFGMGTGNSASQYYYWELTSCTYDTLISGNDLPAYAGVLLKVKVNNNTAPRFTFRGHGSKLNYVCFR